MSAEQGQKSGASDLGTIMALIILSVILYFLWPSYRPYVARAVTAVAVIQSKIALQFAPILSDKYVTNLNALVDRGSKLLAVNGVMHFRQMDGRSMKQVLNIPAMVFAPWVLFSIGLAMYHIKSIDNRGRFRRRFSNAEGDYDIDQFLIAQAHLYPHLRPLLKANPQKYPPRDSPWALKMGYVEFAFKHRLLRDGVGKIITDSKYPHRAAFFDANACAEALRAQLGPRMPANLADLAPYQAAMFGVLAAMTVRDRKGMLVATRLMSSTWTPIKTKSGEGYSLDTSAGQALAEKYWDHPEIQRIRAKHAYFLTVMQALAHSKFNGGELCISHYIWLRPTDPTLFYTLHQQGLEGANLESVAPFFHHRAEVAARMPLIKPAIADAVAQLQIELATEGWLSADETPDGSSYEIASIRRWTPNALEA